WGAIVSMCTGFISYVVATSIFENPFGMHPIAISLFLNITSMIVVSYLTEKPSIEIINKFWGAEPIQNQVNKKDRKSTRLNSSHVSISYAVFCLKKKIKQI